MLSVFIKEDNDYVCFRIFGNLFSLEMSQNRESKASICSTTKLVFVLIARYKFRCGEINRSQSARSLEFVCAGGNIYVRD